MKARRTKPVADLAHGNIDALVSEVRSRIRRQSDRRLTTGGQTTRRRSSIRGYSPGSITHSGRLTFMKTA